MSSREISRTNVFVIEVTLLVDCVMFKVYIQLCTAAAVLAILLT